MEPGASRKLASIPLAFRSKFRQGESRAGQDRAFHPVNPGQLAISRALRIGWYGHALATLEADPCATLHSSSHRQ
jgi:hypothetical protein